MIMSEISLIMIMIISDIYQHDHDHDERDFTHYHDHGHDGRDFTLHTRKEKSNNIHFTCYCFFSCHVMRTHKKDHPLFRSDEISRGFVRIQMRLLCLFCLLIKGVNEKVIRNIISIRIWISMSSI